MRWIAYIFAAGFLMSYPAYPTEEPELESAVMTATFGDGTELTLSQRDGSEFPTTFTLTEHRKESPPFEIVRIDQDKTGRTCYTANEKILIERGESVRRSLAGRWLRVYQGRNQQEGMFWRVVLYNRKGEFLQTFSGIPTPP